MVTKIHWEPTDLVREALVEPLLKDIGIGEDDESGQIKPATRRYALKVIRGWPEDEPMTLTMGDFDLMMGSFADGYEQALKDVRGKA